MLSIIVPVHNQLGHNRLFLQGIRQYTTGHYEMIVINNHSTDGSDEFFSKQGCKVINNTRNLCYPESMNLGLQAAQGDFCCLINNDVYVGVNWNQVLMEAMKQGNLDAVSPMGIEQMPTPALTDWMHDRWALIGRGRLSSGKAKHQLEELVARMYGDWAGFCREVHSHFSPNLYEGILGSCVMLRRSLLEKIGLLDERILAADWDLYYTLRKRERDVGDVHRCMIVGGAYIHHFIRATVKGKPERYACIHPRLAIDDKWPRREQAALWFKPEDFSGAKLHRMQSWTKRLGEVGRKTVRKFVRRCRPYILSWAPLDPAERVLALHRSKFQELSPPSVAHPNHL